MVSRWTSVCLSVHQSVIRPSVCFSFPDDNLSKHQWIFTKLDICTDIVEIYLGIANGQISSIFGRVICPRRDNGEVLFTPGWSQSYLFEVVFVKCVCIWRTSVFFQFYGVLSGVIYKYSSPTYYYYYSKSHFCSIKLCYW